MKKLYILAICVVGVFVGTLNVSAQHTVRWSHLINTTTDNNGVLTKASGVSASWTNSSATSSNVLPASTDGSIEFTITSQVSVQIGFITENYSTIASTVFTNAVSVASNGLISIHEGGSTTSTYGNYTSGDVFKISREGASIKYYRNATVLRTSTANTSQLWVRANIYTNGATSPVVTASFNHNVLLYADVTGAGGTLNNGSAVITPSGGKSPYSYAWSSSETTSTISGKAPGDYTVTVTDDAGRTASQTIHIAYKTTHGFLKDVTQDNGALTKTTAAGWNSAGSHPTNSAIGSGGWIEFTVKDYSSAYVIGFRNDQFLALTRFRNGIYIGTDGNVYTYELSVATNYGKFRAGDVFRIKYDGTNVRYYKNGNEFRYVTATATSFSLKTVVHSGTTPRINCTTDANVIIQGIVEGKASTSATGSIGTSILGGTPPFQYSWSSGETSSGIANNAAGVYTLSVTDAEYRQATQTFNLGYKHIWTNKTNVTANGNGFNRTANPSGANTTNIIPSNEPGYIEWVHLGNGNEYQVGFSNADHSMGLLDFHFSINFPSSALASTYEGQIATYLAPAIDGDVFRISREVNGNIKYYRNGVAILTKTGNYNDFELRAKFVITTGTAPAIICSHDSQLLPVAIVEGASNSTANGSITMAVAGGNGTYTYSWVNSSNVGQGPSIDLLNKPRGAYTFTVSDTDGRSVSRTYEIGYRPKFTSYLMTIGAHSMTKNTSYAYDGGALSSGALAPNENGWIEIVLPDATLYSVYRIGFGVGYSNYLIGSITNGFEMTSSNRILAVEPNIGGSFGNIRAGDVLRIERTGSEVKYIRNGTVKRQVPADPTRELRWKVVVSTGPVPMVNTSFDSKINLTADVVGVGLANNNGAISLQASGGHGNYSYSWSNGETTANISGLAAGTYTVTVSDQESRSKTATFLVGKRPTWTAPIGATLNADQSLTKNVADAQTAGVLTVPSFTGDGWIQFTAPRNTGNYIIGFTVTPNSYVQNTITHGIEVDAATSIVSTRSGATLTYLSSYQPGDVFRISREGTLVKYYRNGAMVRSASVSATSSLRAQAILNTGTAPPVMSSFELDDIQVSVANWGFQYKYDARKRMIGKKVPGADWVYMVYDDRDRLVLTQDGNQRAANQWLFTKYDELNRPVLTGIMDTAANIPRDTMQAVVNRHYKKTGSKWGEARGGSVHNYTNKSYPIVATASRYLTVSYFDDYLWQSSLYNGDRLAFDDEQLINEQVSTALANVIGMPTGGKVKVLDAGATGGVTWLASTLYYDDKGRTIQTIADNYKGGTDITTNILDFTGKITKAKSVHTTADITWKDKTALRETGNLVISTAAAGWNNSGASSTQVLAASAGGSVSAMISAAPATNQWVIGLSNTKVDNLTTTIDFGIGVTSSGQIQTFENGAGVNRGAATIGDVLKVSRDGSVIRFYKNGTQLHWVNATSSTTLIADLSMYGGSTFANATCSFCTASQTTIRTMDYDHAGRLLKTWHQLNGGPNVLLVSNEYNELGQLVTKKLHSDDNGSTFKQHEDYRYNIRGWITRINNADLNTSDGGPKDFFGMEFGYNNDLGVGVFTPQYNGNISATKWSANLGLALPYLNEPTERAYKFTYDPMNRLREANYALNPGGWSESLAFKEAMEYDANGNILSLYRNNKKGSPMDWLVYDYGTGVNRSNRLKSVTDRGIAATGFRDKNTTGDDYAYDNNGNMTVDNNKGLGNIKYNSYLNLKEEINKTTGEKIKYIYNADGVKLAELIYPAGSSTPSKRTDYVGGFVYENDTLRFIQHQEGKIMVPKPGASDPSMEYQYQIKDHLDNVRLTFTIKVKTDEFKATMEDTGIADYSNPRVQEMAYFGNLFETEIRNVNQWLNHTSNTIGNAVYLDGSEERTIGPYTMLKVYPGDTVKMEVFGKYENKSSHTSTPLIAILASLVNPIQSATVGIEGAAGMTSSSLMDGLIPLLTSKGGSSTAPAVYLNYILFDKDFKVADLGFNRIDDAAGFNTAAENTVAFDKMELERIIDRVGYLYVYVSNESEGTRVWLDDLTITYSQSPIVQFEDYYPFGLSQSETAFERGNDKYKGMVTSDGTGLKDLGFRQYDAATGRFDAVDPLAELQTDLSTYQYAGNNPVNQVDVLGLDQDDHDKDKRKKNKETRMVNGKKVKVHNGFVNKQQRRSERAANQRERQQARADRREQREQRREERAKNKESNKDEAQASNSDSNKGSGAGDFDKLAIVYVGVDGPPYPGAGKDELDGIKPIVNSLSNGSVLGRVFNNFSDDNRSGIDNTSATLPIALVYSYEIAQKNPGTERTRQYLYSHHPINEARALYKRTLITASNNYPATLLKENIAVLNNTTTSDDFIDPAPQSDQELQPPNTSTPAEALAVIPQTLQQSTHFPEVSPEEFLDQLRERVSEGGHNNTNQGAGTNFCWAAAIAKEAYERDPKGMTEAMVGLYKNGTFVYDNNNGGMNVPEASQEARDAIGSEIFDNNQDMDAGQTINELDQMLFMTLADHYKGGYTNVDWNYDPDDEEWALWSGGVLSKAVGVWNEFGFDVEVTGSDLGWASSGENKINAVNEALEANDVVLYVNSGKFKRDEGLNATATHYIKVVSIEQVGDKYKITYWDYGREQLPVTMDADQFFWAVYGMIEIPRTND